MSETGIILSQILILAIAVIVGVIAARVGVLTKDSNAMLSKVIFNVSLPLMLFTNFFKLDITPRLLSNSLIVILISAIVILFLLLNGWIITKIVKMPVREAAVFKAHSMLGNIIFLGFPLITALYGKEGLLYASMFQLVSNLLMWTVGVVVLNQGNDTHWMSSLKKILNPNTIAILAGLTCFLFSVRLPDVIITPLSGIGSANTWLCMLYIGALMTFSSVRGLLGKKSIYILSFSRLLLMPVIVIFVFSVLKSYAGITFDSLVSSVVILEIAMPCMASVVIMSRELGADDNMAMANVFISTLFSIGTLPLILLVMNMFI
ncbi:MAG TPA: AEC family transporter [Bacteroidales bacterium]|nr:AEC family transporter [Bacteroidales bacterium]